MSLALAIIVASLMAVVGTPYRTYAAWWSWTPVLSTLGLLLYFAVAGGGGGLLGWWGAKLTGAAPTNELWVRGVLYGFIGAALLRTSIPVKPNASSSGKRDAIQETISALGQVLSWFTGALDYQAEEAATKWFSSLPNADLLYQSYQIDAQIVRETGMSDSGKKAVQKRFVEVIEMLGDQDSNVQQRGHAHLVSMCANHATQQHLSKGFFRTT